MKTSDGKILKCSTSYIRDDDGTLHYVFGINYDITKLTMIESALHALVTPVNKEEKPKEITHSVNDLLDHLIEESVALVGKPVALMNKEDKVTAIQFLNDSGAFLITKSGDKVANYFGISKYTLYSYIDVTNNLLQQKSAEYHSQMISCGFFIDYFVVYFLLCLLIQQSFDDINGFLDTIIRTVDTKVIISGFPHFSPV